MHNLKLFYRALKTKTFWYWHKYRKTDTVEQNRGLRVKPTKLWTYNSDKGRKRSRQWKRESGPSLSFLL